MNEKNKEVPSGKKELIFTLTMTESALMTVMAGIKKLPYEVADPILKGISSQVRDQINKNNEEKPDEKTSV